MAEKEFIWTKSLHHKPSPLRMKIMHCFFFVIYYHFKALLIIELRLLTNQTQVYRLNRQIQVHDVLRLGVGGGGAFYYPRVLIFRTYLLSVKLF